MITMLIHHSTMGISLHITAGEMVARRAISSTLMAVALILPLVVPGQSPARNTPINTLRRLLANMVVVLRRDRPSKEAPLITIRVRVRLRLARVAVGMTPRVLQLQQESANSTQPR